MENTKGCTCTHRHMHKWINRWKIKEKGACYEIIIKLGKVSTKKNTFLRNHYNAAKTANKFSHDTSGQKWPLSGRKHQENSLWQEFRIQFESSKSWDEHLKGWSMLIPACPPDGASCVWVPGAAWSNTCSSTVLRVVSAWGRGAVG